MPNGDPHLSLNNLIFKDKNNFMNEQDKTEMIRKLQEIIEVAVSIHFTGIKQDIKKNYDNHLDIMNNEINISLNSFIENINKNANKRHKSSFNLFPMENKINKLNNDIEDLFNKNLNPIHNKIDLIRSNTSKRLSEIKSYFNNIVKMLGKINERQSEIIFKINRISDCQDRQFNYLEKIEKPSFFKRIMSKMSRGNHNDDE